MSEHLDTSTPKKRRQGQRMTNHERLIAQAAFLTEYELCANIVTAAYRSGIDRKLVYYWQEHDESFSMAFNMADKAANAHIEAEIRRRAIDGVEEPVISQGQPVYEYEPILDEEGKQRYDSKGKPMYKRGRMLTIRKYSDTLLIFYAKRRMPEYREKGVQIVNVLPKEYVNLPEDDGVDTEEVSC